MRGCVGRTARDGRGGFCYRRDAVQLGWDCLRTSGARLTNAHLGEILLSPGWPTESSVRNADNLGHKAFRRFNRLWRCGETSAEGRPIEPRVWMAFWPRTYQCSPRKGDDQTSADDFCHCEAVSRT